MDVKAFTDKSVKPDEDLISSTIGDTMVFWKDLMQYLSNHYNEIKLEWRFYPDAKSWLLPVAVKKKNLAWIVVYKGYFRVSFWFGKKLEGIVENSDLHEKILEEYRKAKQSKMGRGIVIIVNSKIHLDHVKQLLEFKSKIK